MKTLLTTILITLTCLSCSFTQGVPGIETVEVCKTVCAIEMIVGTTCDAVTGNYFAALEGVTDMADCLEQCDNSWQIFATYSPTCLMGIYTGLESGSVDCPDVASCL